MPHEQIMASLKCQLNKVSEYIPENSSVIFIDYPVHLNVGDLLIYQGTLSYFKENNIIVVASYCYDDFDIKQIAKEADEHTIFVLNGGGNFGDLYPAIQKLREDLVESFKNNRIVQLPQSIFYSNESVYEKSKRVFNGHEGIVLFTRDVRSNTLGKDLTENSFLVPDMAHYLWDSDFIKSVKKHKSSATKFLYQARKDKENSPEYNEVLFGADYKVFDWADVVPWWAKIVKNIFRILLRFKRYTGLRTQLIEKFWRKVSQKIVVRSLHSINNSEMFVTTRLHGHISAMLLSKRHIPLDNTYKKVSSYVEQWSVLSDKLVDKT